MSSAQCSRYLTSAYHNNEDLGEDSRIVLKLKPSIAPIKICVSPLLKTKSKLVGKANEIYKTLKKNSAQLCMMTMGILAKSVIVARTR